MDGTGGMKAPGHQGTSVPKDAEWETLPLGMSREKAGGSYNCNVAGGSREITDVVGSGAQGSETWARNISEMF